MPPGGVVTIIMLKPHHIEALGFSLKAAVAALTAVVSYDLLGLSSPGWAAISAVLVIQPTLHSSFKTSMVRVVANIVGAFGGAALAVTLGHMLIALTVGVMLTGLICYLLRVDEALRPAFAAVVIVVCTSDPHIWHSSLERVVAVIVGCVCALGTGFLFDKLAYLIKLFPYKDDDEPRQRE